MSTQNNYSNYAPRRHQTIDPNRQIHQAPDISLNALGRSDDTTTELVDRHNGEYLIQPGGKRIISPEQRAEEEARVADKGA